MAPRVFISYAHDSAEHMEQVREFGTFLRAQIGLEVELDRWFENARRDWSGWAVERLTKADFILVIASPEYRRRADGELPPSIGRGAQFEASILRNAVTEDRIRATERILPVVLPGRSIDDIPSFLNPYSTSRFHVTDFTREGIAELLGVITGRGQHPMPELGEWLESGASRTKLIMELDWTSHNVTKGIAVIDGIAYENSMVLRAKAPGFVEFDLGGKYSRIRSVAGVLDGAADLFQVGYFRIVVDGSPRQERTVAQGKSVTMDVEVTGAMRVRLEVSRPSSSRLAELAWGDPTLS
ncbi:SEFIR domain-containing protein [Kibdelosporangium aridum]|uniref:SEFIR domain-containing protein n=2 Tax=Bacillati TaxID=1783272 RepID=UPI0035F0C5C0